MTNSELYELIDDPSRLSADTLPELRRIVDEFPFFHIARMLYLKNLSVVNDIHFAAELKKMSVSIPDRRKLFTLIEGERYGIQVAPISEKTDIVTDSFLLIEDYLSSRKENEASQGGASFLFQPSVSSDYMHWTLTEMADESEKESPVKLQHHDLIDDFIRNDEQRVPGNAFTLLPPENNNQANTSESHEEKSDNAFFTETLARIYIKQKRYEKALQIIKNLSLKYPEKNVYFADQIRFLEKLIINTKK